MGVYIEWIAHAGFQIRTEEKTIYIDPVQFKKHAHRIGSFFDNPQEADLILVTHHHTDHFQPATIEKVRAANTSIVAPERCVKKIGSKIRTLKPGERITIDDIRVKAVDAYNIERCRASGRPWHPKGQGVGYLVTVEGITMYHAGDTEFIPEMKQLGHVDVAFLPIGQRFTMDIDEAVEAARAIRPRVVMPMHNRETSLEEFKERVEATS